MAVSKTSFKKGGQAQILTEFIKGYKDGFEPEQKYLREC